MKNNTEGIFPIQKKYPCDPIDLLIPEYTLGGILGRIGPEEAAARILRYSQNRNEWVGVSWPRLSEGMQHDLHIIAALRQEHNKRIETRTRKKESPSVFSKVLDFFGFTITEIPPQHDSARRLPQTALMNQGTQVVINGIHELVEFGYLERVVMSKKGEQVSIYFPTILLVNTILKKQQAIGA